MERIERFPVRRHLHALIQRGLIHNMEEKQISFDKSAFQLSGYRSPEMEVVRFETGDVILASHDTDDPWSGISLDW